WTFDDLQELPEDVDWRRYEIVDGALVVSPSTAPLHELVCARLLETIRPRTPSGWEGIGAITVDLRPSYRVSDLTVVRSTVFGPNDPRVQPRDILLIVE